MKQVRSFKKGEIVWTRVLFSRKWWPGLVLKSDGLGVLVSFFDYQKPQYFLESEVCLFEDNFATLIKNVVVNCSTSSVLIDRALKLVGYRAFVALKCPCVGLGQNVTDKIGGGGVSGGGKGGNLFRADEVLGFVVGVAVSPWVDEAEFVNAVTWIAQITTFRLYSLSKQKFKYPTPGALGLVDGCPVFSEGVENKLTDSGVLVSNESLHEDQLDIRTGTQTNRSQEKSLHEMLIKLHCLALDPFYLVAECLTIVKQDFLSFRILSYQNISDFCFKKCSPPKSSEAQISNPWYIETQLSIKADGRKGSREMLCPCLPYMHSPVNRLMLKRQLDQSAISNPYLKLRRTMSFSTYGADAYLQRRKTECEAGLSDAFVSRSALSDSLYKLCKTVPFISLNGVNSYLRRRRTGFETNLFDALFSGSELNLEIPNLPTTGSHCLKVVCNNGLMDLVQNMFNFSLVKHKSHHTDIVEETGMVQEKNENVDTPCDDGTLLSYVKIQEPEKGVDILTENGTCICYANDDTEKITYGVHTEDVKVNCNKRFLQSSDSKSELNFVIGTNADDNEVGQPGEGTRKRPLHSHLAADQMKMRHGNGDDSTFVKTNRLVSMNLAFGDNFKENKELDQCFPSDMSFKSQVAQQSKAHASFAFCKSLHMKFPKDYNLPSKKELVKKFSLFGRVDSLRTKVFSFTGSAQVVFLQSLDAVAAYQYAKRKKVVFGRANVRFWLDPFEHKRRKRTKFSVPFPSLSGKPVLKSCLKKSNSTEKEAKGGPRKVRFVMET